MSKKHFLKGTFILTCAGLLTRLIGFFYRIFLSHTIGAQGVGIYQLLMPVQGLVMAVTTTGIQTAISRLAASELALGKQKEARDTFSIGTFSAFLLSVTAAFLLYSHADFFAVQILKEPRTMPLIKLLSFSFPLSTIHTCINSFSFAQQKTGMPSFIQLLEQLVRVGVTYLLYLIFLSEAREITPVIALGGTLAGECAATLVSLLCIGRNFQVQHYTPFQIRQPLRGLKKVFQMSFPLMLNRVLLTLLGSIEVVLIPQRLRMYGLNSEDALSIYGIFTGMAMPLILFPSTITNSASMMLMPSIAEFQALGHKKRIRYVTSLASRYCLLLGIGCCALFFFFGRTIGMILFKSPTAGNYIHILAFICPFLYLNTTLSSILNGLGKPGTCLIHNAVGISIRITFVLFAIPNFGIRGYLYGILLGETVLAALHLKALWLIERSTAE
ncbi:MAG: polysaccharide biosynthesis protein [Eubacteriales bacterium]|nr:polysaccharide biosynthesis protein [Eubacteriales bacterium]